MKRTVFPSKGNPKPTDEQLKIAEWAEKVTFKKYKKHIILKGGYDLL